jgi:hypothetical protein
MKRPQHSLTIATHLALVAIAVATWANSLHRIHIRSVNDLGLISVLPVETFVALALLTVGFCVLVSRGRAATALLVLYVLALIVMLYAIPNFVEHEPRFGGTYRHVGIVQYVIATGHVNPSVDAFFNWPGFFVLAAFVAKAAGIKNVLGVAAWAPLFYNLMYLGPLLLILRAASIDRRIVWYGIWLFYAADWIGQDYFSPQGLTYFLYLVVLAIVLTWFPRDRRLVTRPAWSARVPPAIRSAIARLDAGQDPPSAAQELSPGARAGLIVVATAVFAAVVPSHQLTPFAALAGVGALALVNGTSVRTMPYVMTVLTGTWISFMTVSYLAGHSRDVTGHAGKVEGTLAASLSNRLTGSQLHLAVVSGRIGVSIVLWSVAAYGAWRAFRAGRRVLPYVALALASFPIILLQPYGGEILLRVYLFSLPFMVFFAASAVFLLPTRVIPVVSSLFAVAIIAGFLLARYGNERMDYFTKGEVDAVERLYAVAPPGSSLFALEGNLPWKFKGYTAYRYDRVVPSLEWRRISSHPRLATRGLADLLGAKPHPAFLIITRSQAAAAELGEGVKTRVVTRFEQAIVASPRFRTIYRNRDAAVFMLVRQGASRR